MFRRNVRWTFRRNTYAIDVPGFQGAEPSGKFRSSPKAGSGAEWLATLRNLPVISPPLNRYHLSNFIPTVVSTPTFRWQWFCGAGTDCNRKRKSPHSIDFSFLKQAGHAPLRCEVSDNHVPYPALYISSLPCLYNILHRQIPFFHISLLFLLFFFWITFHFCWKA